MTISANKPSVSQPSSTTIENINNAQVLHSNYVPPRTTELETETESVDDADAEKGGPVPGRRAM